jgi:hypothetical protein
MGRRLFKQSYYRGTITTSSEFPALADRKEGMYWIINVDADVKDRYLRTAKTPAAATGTISTSGTTLTGDGTTIGTDVHVGARIIVGEEERYIVSSGGATAAVLNAAFTEDITAGTSFTFIDRDGASKKVYLPTGHNDVTHADYRKVKGSGTAFTTDLNIGDIIYFLNGSIVVAIEVESLTSATEFMAKYAYMGTITGIDTSGESVVYIRDELPLTITNSTNDNLKKKIEWVTLAAGEGWAITVLS